MYTGRSSGDVMRLVTAISHGSFTHLDFERPFYVPVQEIQRSRPRPPPKPVRRKLKIERQPDRARVLFSYVAENEDELSINEGEIITIVEKELEDSGWWKGELNGKVGVFPDNFVDILPPEEQKPKKPPPPTISKPDSERPALRPLPGAEPKSRPDEKKAAPALPTKKPAMPPPPIGKKPLGPKHSTDLIAQTDDHKVKESQKEFGTGLFKLPNPTPMGRIGKLPAPHPPNGQTALSDQTPKPSNQNTEEIDLDIVPSAEPLSHPNANRVRAPQRRPPTIHNKEKNKKVEPQVPTDPPEQDEIDKEEPPPSGPAPPIPEFPDSPRLRDAYARRSHRRAQQKAELQKYTVSSDHELIDGEEAREREAPTEPTRPRLGPMARPAPPLPKNEPPPSPTPPRSLTPREDITDSVQNEETVRAVADLRRELESLKNSTVPTVQYEQLKNEVVHLRELTGKLEKLTTVLMNDIDEGTKERKSMQVEIDRIRKLSMVSGGSS